MEPITNETVKRKMLAGIDLTDEEFERLFSWLCPVEEIEGDERRFHREMASVFEINDAGKSRYFQVNWRRGLTEYQDDIYLDYFEVQRQEVRRIVITIYWEPIKSEG